VQNWKRLQQRELCKNNLKVLAKTERDAKVMELPKKGGIVVSSAQLEKRAVWKKVKKTSSSCLQKEKAVLK